MSAAYILAVKENASEAIHVYDKFHVVQLVNEAVDKVRRSVWNQETDLENVNSSRVHDGCCCPKI